MKRRNPQAGLTLLETMIALIIMALMAVVISASLGGGVRVLIRSGAVQDELLHALARHDLRHWVDHALTAPAPDDARALLRGRPDGFDMLVLPPDGPFWPGHATALKLMPDAVLQAEGHDSEGAVQRRVLALAPPGSRVALRYWGRPSTDQAATWRSDWPEGAALPVLIQIRFLPGPDADIRVPPPLTLHLAGAILHSEMSLSSPLPPALPSRP